MRVKMGQLRWQLALSYAFVTALATFVWLLGVWLLTTYILFYSATPQVALLRHVTHESLTMQAALTAQPIDVKTLSSQINSYRRLGYWQVINELGFHYNVPLDSDSTLIAVTDADGNIVTSNVADPAIANERLSTATSLLTASLFGDNSWEHISARYATGIAVAVAIVDGSAQVRGALVVLDEAPVWQQPGQLMLQTALSAILPNFVLVVPFAVIFGLLAGFVAARPLSRRIRAISSASLLWSQGQLDATVNDLRGDELGQLSHRLDSMAKQLSSLMQTRQEAASLQERDRIARDLHDSAKQQAYAVAGQLAAARAWLARDPAKADAHLIEAEKLNDDLRTELSGLILELRPPQLRTLGLVAALKAYGRDWSHQTGISCNAEIDTLTELDEATEQVLFRIVQEALANVVRHSRAQRVWLRLVPLAPDQTVALEIEDDGRGFDSGALTAGFGLTSMRSRAEAIGARFDVHTQIGNGTTIRVVVPTRSEK